MLFMCPGHPLLAEAVLSACKLLVQDVETWDVVPLP